jgi:hypothetical protein
MGMVLYEMLAGRPPFEATSPHQFYMHHSEERDFQPVALPPDLPGGTELQAAIRKALQRDRAKRFQSAREFADALEQFEKSLPDPGAMKTMALAFDADATMKVPPANVDTLHRTTVRETQAPPPPPPPPPARAPAAATVVTAIHPPVPAKRSSSTPIIVVALLFIFLVGAAVLGAWLLTRNRTAPPPILGQTASTATTATSAPSTTSVDVTTTTGEPPLEEMSAPITTTTAAPTPVPTPTTPPKGKTMHTETAAPAEEEPAAEEPAAEPAAEAEPEPEPASDGVTYLARGDETHNEAVVEHLRQALRGTTRISVRGGAMESELVTRLRDELPNLDIVPTANVVIDFDGRIDHLPRGRKTRAARATIRKNGQVVFRYIMTREIYRMGNTPAEAFVGVLSDALDE